MYSAANQFEMKDVIFEFGIKVSLQGSNVKIKLTLKTNLQRLQSQFLVKSIATDQDSV